MLLCASLQTTSSFGSCHAMLRCDPSRIHMTQVDLLGLEERIALRRRKSLNRGNARLSLGPGLQTTFSVVEPHANVRKQEPASTASQATLCAADDTENDVRARFQASHAQTPVAQEAVSEEPVTSKAKHQTTRGHAAEALEAILHKVSPPRLPFQHNTDSTPASHIPGLGHRRRKTTPPEHTIEPLNSIAALDGAVDQEAFLLAGRQHTASPGATDTALRSGVHGATSTPANRLSTTTHGRRVRTRSHDGTIQVASSALSMPGQARYLRSAQVLENPQPIVEVRRAQLPAQATLDPGAPVFTPRVRFGTTVTIDDSEDFGRATRANTAHNSLHPVRGLSDLRLRSPSEQNVDPASRSRIRPTAPSAHGTAPPLERSTAVSAITRQHPSTDRPTGRDDNGTLPRPSPNLERYPLLLPTTNTGRRRSNSGRSDSSQPEQAIVRLAITPEAVEATPSPRSSIRLVVDKGYELLPGLSASSPNDHLSSSLPMHPDHGLTAFDQDCDSSAAAWRPTSSQSQRVPSMCSAASGISSIEDSAQRVFSRHTSAGTLDAAAEFLRFRSSPLDDLTAELSRLSTALSAQRPVSSLNGRESRSGGGVRLLNGDPFRQSISLSSDREMPGAHPEASRIPQSAALRVEEQTAGLPPATESRTVVPEASRTPHAPKTTGASPEKSPSGTVATPHHRSTTTPHHPHTAATPKLPIYNDATPAHLQPQTPADIPTQARRRQDLAIPYPPPESSVFVGRVAIATPPIIPERRFYRNTYPTAVAGSGSAHRPGLERTRSGRRHQRSASAEEAENDIEGQLVGLEADRRVWLGRRGDMEEGNEMVTMGGLETTPPGEGRFERFLN